MSKKNEHPIQVISHERRQARATMRVPLTAYSVRVPPETEAAMRSQGQAQLAAPTGQASQMAGDQIYPVTFADVQPQDSDYIYPLFRAISAVIIPGLWLDYSEPGVLEASAPLLKGQTVYVDHYYWSVTGWIGAVNEAFWDAAGTESGGVPGINAELKIDCKVAPKVARGMMMKPPAIHSVSVTVLFEFDYSHPQLVEERRFWALLGEEIDGEIVRLIVTKILEFWEISPVFQGADRLAKRLPGDESAPEDEDDLEELSAASHARTPALLNPSQRSKTVKLTAEQKAAYGITHESEDVPDELVAAAMQRLAQGATVGEQMLETARAECRRVATLATFGSEEGTLPAHIASLINKADPTELAGLTQEYSTQAAKKFPQGGRSSVEDSAAVHDAGGINAPATRPTKRVPLF